MGVFKELLREFMVPELGKIQQEFEKMRVETKQEFAKVRSETRQEFERVRAENKQELAKVRIEIRDDIIDVIDQNIQPQITSAVSRITRLERKVA